MELKTITDAVEALHWLDIEYERLCGAVRTMSFALKKDVDADCRYYLTADLIGVELSDCNERLASVKKNLVQLMKGGAE